MKISNQKGASEVLSYILVIFIVIAVVGLIAAGVMPAIEKTKSQSKFQEAKMYVSEIEQKVNELMQSPNGSVISITLDLDEMALEIDSNLQTIEIVQTINGDYYKEGDLIKEGNIYTFREMQKLIVGLDLTGIEIIDNFYLTNSKTIVYIKKIDKNKVSFLREIDSSENVTLQGRERPVRELVFSIDILTPSDNSSTNQGDEISFTSEINNPSGSYTCAWASSIDGSLSSDCNFSTSSLSVGSHTITLSATDQTETKTKNISLTISQNIFTTISILSPENYSIHTYDETIGFTSVINDPDGSYTCAWSSSIDGSISNDCNFSSSSLSEGNHLITLSVTDQNQTITDSINISKYDYIYSLYLDYKDTVENDNGIINNETADYINFRNLKNETLTTNQQVFNSSTTFTVPNNVNTLKVLVVAGGGGGGTYAAGAGGGAGGLIYNSNYSVTPNESISVVVGAGGAGATASSVFPTKGGNSIFKDLNAVGGGIGGRGWQQDIGGNGGSGGGGSGSDGFSGFLTYAGGQSTAGQGYNGGSGRRISSNKGAGGGGGGAGQAGGDAGNEIPGNGGNGLDFSSVFGTAVGENGWFAGGGGGTGYSTATTVSVGGNGGGGDGLTGTSHGLANTGGGGGGNGALSGAAGNGGSGVVIVKYDQNVSLYDNLILNISTNGGMKKRISAPNTYIEKIYDQSTSLNDANQVTTTSQPLLENKGMRFDGTDDAIVLKNSITLANTAWTTSAWVNFNNTNRNSVLSNLSGGPVYNDLAITNGKIAYHHYNGSWLTESGSVNVADGAWHFVTWVNYANQKMNMYVDGVLDASQVSSTVSSTAPVNQIGRNWYVTSNGLIDNVMVFNKALTEQEILYLYTNNNKNAEDTYTLYILKTGSGTGTVTSSPSGISCGSTCTYDYNYNTSFTLTAVASAGSTFTGWSGDCSGTTACNLILSEDKNVTANFNQIFYSINILTPSDNSSSEQGDEISFTSEINNPSGSYTCAWASSIDGSLSSDCNFSTNSLSGGSHTITLSVTDTNQTLQQTKNITVNTLAALKLAQYISKVESDSGEIIDINNTTNIFNILDQRNLFDNLLLYTSADLGIKKIISGNDTLINKLYDVSDLNKHITQATSSYQPKLIENRMAFEGTQHLNTSVSIYNTTSTVSFWFYLDPTVFDGTYNGVLVSGDWAGAMGIVKAVNRINTWYRPQSGTIADHTLLNTSSQMYKWYHISVTHNYSTGEVKSYVDGVLIATTIASSANGYGANPLSIANSNGMAGGETYTKLKSGRLNDIIITNNVLTNADINYIYNNTKEKYNQVIPLSGLVLHLDANSITGLADGQAISQWDDLSGNNNHVTQSNALYRPLYKTNTIGTLPTVRFNLSYLNIPNLKVGNTNHTEFIVLRIDSNQVDGDIHDRFFSFWNGATADDWTAPSWRINAPSYLNGSNEIPLRIITNNYSGGSQILTNGVIGARADNHGNMLKGDIAEVIIYDRSLTAGEVASIESYLTNKWLILDGSSSERAAPSAMYIKNNNPSATNGIYWILKNGVPTQIYCDMESDGGGWMLYSSFSTDNNYSSSYPAWNGNRILFPNLSTYGFVLDYYTHYTDGINSTFESMYIRRPGFFSFYYGGLSSNGLLTMSSWNGPSDVNQLRVYFGLGTTAASFSMASGNLIINNSTVVTGTSGDFTSVSVSSFDPDGTTPLLRVEETGIAGISWIFMR